MSTAETFVREGLLLEIRFPERMGGRMTPFVESGNELTGGFKGITWFEVIN